jgi:hypothetical protein
VSGGGNPDVVRNLSVFAFRPMGLFVAPSSSSSCVGTGGESRFTDVAGRTRAYAFKIVAGNSPEVTLEVEGSVQFPSGTRLQQRGTVSVDLTDGLAGQALIREHHSTDAGARPSPPREQRRVVVIRRHIDLPRNDELHVLLTADGVLYCDQRRTDLGGLRSAARAAVAVNNEVRVVLGADKRVAHGKVVELIDALKQVGIRKFALEVEVSPPEKTHSGP